MKIQTFKNMTGLLHGSDDRRVDCDMEGILKIGTAEIHVIPGGDSILPALFNGCTGNYKASFTDTQGNVYDLDSVQIRGGRVVPPPQTAVEFMELRTRTDALEDECARLNERINILAQIFDTDSLNFLIK